MLNLVIPLQSQDVSVGFSAQTDLAVTDPGELATIVDLRASSSGDEDVPWGLSLNGVPLLEKPRGPLLEPRWDVRHELADGRAGGGGRRCRHLVHREGETRKTDRGPTIDRRESGGMRSGGSPFGDGGARA